LKSASKAQSFALATRNFIKFLRGVLSEGIGSTGHRPVSSGDPPEGMGWLPFADNLPQKSDACGRSDRRVADRYGRVARSTYFENTP